MRPEMSALKMFEQRQYYANTTQILCSSYWNKRAELIGIGQRQEKKKKSGTKPSEEQQNKTKQNNNIRKQNTKKSHLQQNEIWKRGDKNTSVWQAQTSMSILSFPMR